ncbi:MAG: carbohydrate ABC transporter substrate-binding protein [Oscillospiraceae bacterium]|nr:carbohydrate ABC transporter substrate-binding protein [Oscillospiraceae bacterium]
MKKKAIALVLALVMVLALAACGGSASTGASSNGPTLTIFNSKMEIQSQMEEMAQKYSAEKGVNVEVYYSSDTVAAHMSTRYASNEPYALAMVDAKDIYSLGPEHAIDLSGEKWVGDTTQAISVDGKVLGFPVCVEARGILYNGDAIKAATGKDFDPASIKTTADFQALIDAIVAGGMALPVGVQKEDWSLGAHFLQEVYELHDDPDAFIAGIKDGSVKLADDKVFNALMDTFDVLKAYNYAKDAPISAEREVTEMMLAEGNLCFKFGGNWDWSNMVDTDYTEHLGMMAVPSDLSGYNEKLVGGGSKFFFVDNSVSEEQQQAAKDFLNWLVYDEEGQDFLVNTCALVPAFSNITLPVSDPLGSSVKAFADKGALVGNYNYAPDDHYAKCGASFQKYLAGQIDRAGLADEITAYWATAEVGAH